MTENQVQSLVAVVWPDGADDRRTLRAERSVLRSVELAVANPDCPLAWGEVVVITPEDPDVEAVVAEALESTGADAVLLVEASGYCAPVTVSHLVAALDQPDVVAVDARHLPVERPEFVDPRTGAQADYSSSCALVLAPHLQGDGERVIQAPGAVFARMQRLDTDAVVHPAPGDLAEPAVGALAAVTVVIRTQGRRPATLIDVLCCLAVQTDQDFEIVIVVHDGDVRSVRDLADSFEPDFADRIRVLECVGGQRGRPANVGAQAARGQYVVFLDDDDAVTAEWIATVTEGARRAPGRVIRWWAASQPRTWGGTDGIVTHRPAGPLAPTYTHPFNVVQHLWGNQTPFHTFAFPRDILDEGFAFDETLPVVEDWEFLLRVALRRGVHDMERITCIYHRFDHSASAGTVTSAQWEAVKDAVRADLDRGPLTLPPGSIADLIALHRRANENEREVSRLRKEVGKLQARVTDRKPKPSPAPPPAIESVQRAVGRLKGKLRRD